MKRFLAIIFALALVFSLSAGAFAGDAEAPAESGGGGGGFLESGGTILMLVAFIPLMYFFFIRPESKKKKQRKQMMDELAVGSDITTIGGIMGTVVDMNEEGLTIETGEDRVRMEITKWSISTIGRATSEQQK